MLISALTACGQSGDQTQTTTTAPAVTTAATAAQTTAAATTAATTAAATTAAAQTTTAAVLTTSSRVTTTATQATTTAAPDAKPVTIDFWHIWPVDVNAENMTNLLNNFKTSYPHITVNELALPFFDYLDKLAPALAAGTSSDLMIGDLGNPKGRAIKGQIMNIQKYVDEWRLDMGQFFPATVEQCTYEGDLYGLPFITDTRVMYWNKDHFKEAGLDPESPPKTWEDMIAYNEILTSFNDDGTIKRLGFSTRIGNFFEWTLGWTYGAELWNPDGTPNIDSPEMLKACNTALTIQQQVGLSAFDGFNENSRAIGISPFITGDMSIIIHTNGFYANIKEYNPDLVFGVALLPTDDGVNHRASWGNGFSLEITDKGDDDKSRAAFELAAFLCRTDNATEFVLNCADYVCNATAYDDPRVFADPVWVVMAESGKYTRFRNFVLEYPTWYGSLQPEWEAVLMGQKEPKQGLEDAQKRIIEEMENYRLTN